MGRDEVEEAGEAGVEVVAAQPVQAATIGAANFGGYFFLSLYLQQVNGYSPLRAGLAFLPIGLSAFTGSLISHRLVARIGARNQLILGTGVAAAGLIWLAVTLTPVVSYLSTVLGPLILFGGGIGMSFGAMAMAATHGVPRTRPAWPRGCSTPPARSEAPSASRSWPPPPPA